MSFAKGLENYEPVEERLARFWAAYPKGRVLTEIVLGVADDKEIVIRADVYTDREDLRPAATGFAQETKGSTPVNRTSWLENCETSAIGRALANLGFAPKGSRPSREEMDKSQRPAKAPSKAAEAPAPKDALKPPSAKDQALRAIFNELKKDGDSEQVQKAKADDARAFWRMFEESCAMNGTDPAAMWVDAVNQYSNEPEQAARDLIQQFADPFAEAS